MLSEEADITTQRKCRKMPQAYHHLVTQEQYKIQTTALLRQKQV